jgi:Flp pilus assembly protein CpaB
MNLLPPPGPLGRILRLVRRLRRRVLLHRRLLAALCAGGAVLVGLQVAAPPPPETVTVWTAARDLAGGDVLGADDLTATRFAPETVPDGAVRRPAAVVGRTLAAPLTRGAPLTRVSTLARGLLRGYPGTTAVPLRITDAAVVDLLRVGDRISLVVADPDGRRTPSRLVDDVPVIAIPKVHESLSSGTPGRLVVAAIPSDDASDVAAAAATSILIPVWSR